MELLLSHIPHIALILALALLFIRMEVGERRMSAAAAGGGDADAGVGERLMGVRGALRTVLLTVLLASIAVLVVQALRGVDPSAFIVIDYLATGAIAAIWIAWAAPRRLAPGVQERLGGVGRLVVRTSVLVAVLGGVIIAGMALSHGVVLPAV